MGTDNEKPTLVIDENFAIYIDGEWVGYAGDHCVDLIRTAFAAANEPVGMTVPEMIEWLDGGGELEWFEPCNGGWRPAPVWLEPAGWANQEARRPQYRRKAKAEVVPDKVPLHEVIGRVPMGHNIAVRTLQYRRNPDGWIWDGGGRHGGSHLPIDDDGLVAVKPS